MNSLFFKDLTVTEMELLDVPAAGIDGEFLSVSSAWSDWISWFSKHRITNVGVSLQFTSQFIEGIRVIFILLVDDLSMAVN